MSFVHRSFLSYSFICQSFGCFALCLFWGQEASIFEEESLMNELLKDVPLFNLILFV